MLRPRFTLRALLVIVTVAAIGLGVWRVGYSRRPISELDSQTIALGMSGWQVRYLLGPPHRVYRQGNVTKWAYALDGMASDYFYVEFQDGRVIAIAGRGWLHLPTIVSPG